MLAGSIANSKLVNSSILIGTSSVSLGATASSLTGIDSVSANSITVAGQPTTYGYVNGSYLFAYNNADQTSVGLAGAVNFQVTSVNNGSLITKTSNSQVTLTAGNTYILRAVIGRLTSSSTWAQFKWYDVTNGAYVGAEGFSEVVNSSGAVGSTNVPIAYVTPNVNTTYELRQTTSNTITVNAYASMEVIQVNPKIAVQATATGTIDTSYAKYTRSSQQTGATTNTVIVCNVLENTGGLAVSVNTSTGRVTLTAGKTYRLRGGVPGWTASSGGRPAFMWYNETDSTWIGQASQTYNPADAAAYGATGGHAEAVFTANATTVVSFRVLSASQTLALGANGDWPTSGSYPWIDVQEITATFALNALDTMTLTGALTATGSITSVGNVSGNTLISTNASGGEGGEIQLAKALTSTLSGSNVTIDQYADRLRIFENSGSFRGAYIDLSTAPAGVSFLINNRASGIVNAGVDVTLGNLKARIPTSGNRSLQVSTVSGTYSVAGSSTYSQGGVVSGVTIQSTGLRTINTTPAYLNPGYNFSTDGATDTWVIYDTSNSLCWRITFICGPSYVNNFISIERML